MHVSCVSNYTHRIHSSSNNPEWCLATYAGWLFGSCKATNQHVLHCARHARWWWDLVGGATEAKNEPNEKAHSQKAGSVVDRGVSYRLSTGSSPRNNPPTRVHIYKHIDIASPYCQWKYIMTSLPRPSRFSYPFEPFAYLTRSGSLNQPSTVTQWFFSLQSATFR